MTIRIESHDGAPDWTTRDWERYLAQVEEKRANILAGVPNADGSRSFIFEDGLAELRQDVSDRRAEVNELEARL